MSSYTDPIDDAPLPALGEPISAAQQADIVKDIEYFAGQVGMPAYFPGAQYYARFVGGTLSGAPKYNILSPEDASFETGLGTWGPGSDSTLYQHSSGLDGSYSLALEVTSVGSDQHAYEDVVNPCLPNTEYTAVVSLQAVDQPRDMFVALETWTANSDGSFGTYQGACALSNNPGMVDNSTGWITFPITGTTPAGAAWMRIQVGLTHSDGIPPLTPPAAPTVTPTGTTGSTTYSYEVTATNVYGETTPSPAGSTTTGNATLSATDYNAVALTADTGAAGYNIYRTAAPSGVGLGLIGSTTTLAFDDTGQTATTAAPPTTNTTGETHLIDCAGIFPGSPGYDLVVMGDGAIAYWPLDDPVGSTTAENLLSETAGTVNGTVTFGQPGVVTAFPSETAALLDGSTGYVTGSNGPTGILSVEAWFKRAATQPGNSRIVNNDHTDVSENGFEMFLGSGNTLTWIVGDGTSSGAATDTISITDTNWHHAVGVYTGSELILYLDGAQVASGSFSGSVTAGASPITIGRGTYGLDYFAGDIANVAIYPVALTAAQVANHYAAASATGNLVQRWFAPGIMPPFYQPGDISVDQSGKMWIYSSSNSWKEIGASVLPPNLGDGSDGAVTISADTTLTRDMNYSSLTVNSGVTLYTNGYAIRCTGTVTIDGTIDNSATSTSNTSLGRGGKQGTLGGGANSTLAIALQDYPMSVEGNVPAPATISGGAGGDVISAIADTYIFYGSGDSVNIFSMITGEPVGSIGGFEKIVSIAVSGNLLFAGVDIPNSSPQCAIQIADIYTYEIVDTVLVNATLVSGSDMVVGPTGETLYFWSTVTTSNYNLMAMDIASRSMIGSVGNNNSGGPIWAGSNFIAIGSNSGVTFLDPITHQVIGILDGFIPLDLLVVGSDIYIATTQSGYFIQMDATSFIVTNKIVTNLNYTEAAIFNEYAIYWSTTSASVTIIDIANNTFNTYTLPFDVLQATFDGTYFYICSESNSNVILVINTSGVIVKEIYAPIGISTLYIQGSNLLVGNLNESYLIDIQNPLVTAWPAPTLNTQSNVQSSPPLLRSVIIGNTLYYVSGTDIVAWDIITSSVITSITMAGGTSYLYNIGGTLYALGVYGVAYIDVSTNTITGTITLNSSYTSTAAYVSGSYLMVLMYNTSSPSSGDGLLQIIDTTTNTITSSPNIGIHPEFGCVTSDGNLWVTFNSTAEFQIITPSTGTVKSYGSYDYNFIATTGSYVAMNYSSSGVGYLSISPISSPNSSNTINIICDQLLTVGNYFVVLDNNGTINIIDPSTNSVVFTVPQTFSSGSSAIYSSGSNLYIFTGSSMWIYTISSAGAEEIGSYLLPNVSMIAEYNNIIYMLQNGAVPGPIIVFSTSALSTMLFPYGTSALNVLESYNSNIQEMCASGGLTTGVPINGSVSLLNNCTLSGGAAGASVSNQPVPAVSGAGGGVVAIFANSLAGNGTISANGGNGFIASSLTKAMLGAAGGGGGVIALLAESAIPNTLTLQVKGGSGAANNPNVTAANGQNGNIVQYVYTG